jgi:hypothetical protein
MPTPSDGHSMHLDPHILDFLKALEAQGGHPLRGPFLHAQLLPRW